MPALGSTNGSVIWENHTSQGSSMPYTSFWMMCVASCLHVNADQGAGWLGAVCHTISLLCGNGTFLAYVQLYPPGPPGDFLQSCFPVGQPLANIGTWGCSSPGAGLRTFQNIPVSPFLQPVSPAPSLWMAAWPFVISVTLPSFMSSADSLRVCCSIIQLINADIKQDWTQYWPLGYTTSYWPPTRLHVTDLRPLGLAIQTVFNLYHCSSSLHFISFFMRILWETVSKALLKSWWTISTACSTKGRERTFRKPLSKSLMEVSPSNKLSSGVE